MRGLALLLAVTAIAMPGCVLFETRASEDEVQRQACVMILNWVHDSVPKDELYDNARGLHIDARQGEVNGEAVWREIALMFKGRDEEAIEAWADRKPCRRIEKEQI